MDISIVIPAFNEAVKIGRDLETAASFLSENGFDGEVIVVDDGSTDGTTEEAGLPRRITDSQCGFKVYKGEAARELFAGLITTGFLFELEVILKALRRGLRVEEFPVQWTCDLDSRLHPSAQAGSVLRELLKVRSISKKA
jgi:hypothetical protein